MISVETRQRLGLRFKELPGRGFGWLVAALARAAVLLATLLVALATASPAFAAADVTYTFSGTLGPSDADTNSLDVEGSVTGPATGSCPGGSGAGGAGCATSWSITIDGQTFTRSNSSQINGSISQFYINFDLGSYPAPFGENGCNYLPLPNIPLDDPDQDDTDWGQDWHCIYGHTMFTVNFALPNFDMNHDGGLHERYAETVTSFTLVGGNTAPVITSNGGGATAAVNAAENQTAVTTVEATDTEDDAVPTPLTFSITGGADAGKFDIGSASGILSFKVAPDFETPTDSGPDNVYEVEVTVTDSGLLTAMQAIAVTVTDVNEDTEPPSVQILGAPASLSDLTPFTVTIQFSEDVTGFVAGEVTVGNGTASDFSVVEADTYTVLITPTGNGYVSIDVAAGVAEDAATNPNTAAVQIVVGNSIVSDTQKLVSDFVSTRASLITLSQPDLVDRLTRDGGDLDAPLSYFASGDFQNYTLGFSTSLKQLRTPALDGIVEAAPADGAAVSDTSSFDIWIDGKWAHADHDSTDADFGALHLGADYRLDPDLLVGLMGQLDWTSQRDAIAGTAADGMGWMVGPYVVARLQEHLLFDASMLGGQSANHVDPQGLYIDSFDTDRWLAKAQLTGDFELGAFTFSPMLAASYFGETQRAYTDGLGNTIPTQTIGLGSFDFGPRVSYLIESEGVNITPSLGLIGSWAYSLDGAGASATELSARVESGIDLLLDGGASLNAKAFYDGIGVADRSAYGASGRLSVPLN